MIHELKGNRHVRTRAVSVFALSAMFASALASFASLPARENLMSCSMDGRGTPNVFGVCVEFPAESGRPGFYCGEDMTVNYIPCALRNRVGSCEMQSERGPFLVHYYSPQRNGSGLPEFCAQRGKYHAPNSGYTLTLGPSPRKQPDPGKLLEETKEVSSWKESAGSPKEDGLPDKPGGDKSAIRSCSPDAKGSHTGAGACVEFSGSVAEDYCAIGGKVSESRCDPSGRIGTCRIEKPGTVIFVHHYPPALKENLQPTCEKFGGTLYAPGEDFINDMRPVEKRLERCNDLIDLLRKLYEGAPATPQESSCNEYGKMIQLRLTEAPGLDAEQRSAVTMIGRTLCTSKQNGTMSFAAFEAEFRKKRACPK